MIDTNNPPDEDGETGDHTTPPDLAELEAHPDVVIPDNVDESDEKS